jgi:putative FmdB family regulatory protein
VSVPLYEYKCVKCGKRTEKIENVNGPHLKKCPHCGGKVESLISAPSIQFKGTGWYVTDYAGKSKGGDGSSSGDKSSSAEKKAGESKDSSSKETPKKNESSSEKKSEKTSRKN